jgi:hypothetical protein
MGLQRLVICDLDFALVIYLDCLPRRYSALVDSVSWLAASQQQWNQSTSEFRFLPGTIGAAYTAVALNIRYSIARSPTANKALALSIFHDVL